MPKDKPLPPHLRPERIEGEVEAAIHRGEFDDLPGEGRPLSGLSDVPFSWVKDKLKREGASVLPESLQLRLDREAALARMRSTGSERDARELLLERIRRVNATVLSGPPTHLMPLDVEETMERWRRGEL